MRAREVSQIVVITLTLSAVTVTTSTANDSTASTTTPTQPCTSPEASQFDFWLGEWDLTWEGGVGENIIRRELDGCVIEENFRAYPDSATPSPLIGNSVSVYNLRLKRWQQTWVDNSGSYLDFSGGLVGDSMIISREFINSAGATIKQRMVWYNITSDSLNWNWERIDTSDSTASGWKVIWRIHYRRQ